MRSRLIRRLRLLLAALLIGAALSPALPFAAAQGDDPAAAIETLALRAHLQNLRAMSYTAWIGGPLGDPAHAPRRTAVGERLQGWTLDGLAGDPGLEPDDLQRPALLNFWASWCAPCRLEFPALVAVATAPQDHHFDVIFVNSSDTARSASAFLADYPPEIATVIDTGDRLGRRASIETLPTSLLIDTDGTVLAAHVGLFTPTIAAFFDGVAAHPGVGSFVAAEHLALAPIAELLPVDPQSALPLEPDVAQTGAITTETPQHAYRFSGRAGDSITLRATATGGDLDTYLVLLAPDGTRLAEVDDINPGIVTDSALEQTLPADGTYLVVVTRFLEAEGPSSGTFSLVLSLTPGASPQRGGWTQRVGNGFIGYNSDTVGALTAQNHRALFAFEAQAGDVVTLRVTHAPEDAPLTIEVKDTRLQRFALSTPAQEGAASLTALALPEAGIYRVTISRERSAAATEEPFTLSLQLVAGELPANALPAPGAPPQATPAQSGGTLAYGETVYGTISDAQFEQRWSFAGRTGDRITLVMERAIDAPGGLDGYLLLLGPDGTTLAEVDDARGAIMPALESYALPQDGTYTVVTTRFGFANGFSTGDYSLTLTATPGAPAVPGERPPTRWFSSDALPDGLRWIGYNQRASGAIDAANIDDWYVFQGRAGDVLDITLEPSPADGALDPLLILTSSDGYELAYNDDAGPQTRAAAIAGLVLPADGTYLLRATRYGFANGPSSGAYVLEIRSSGTDAAGGPAASPLAYGDTVSGALSLMDPIDRYRFTGRAGDLVSVLARPSESEFALTIVLRDPGGAILAESAADGAATLRRLRLPADGTYTLEVQPTTLNTPGAYDLILLGYAAPPVSAGTFVPAPNLALEVVLIWASSADLDLRAIPGPGAPIAEQTAAANDFCAATTTLPVERLIVPAGDAGAPIAYTLTVSYALNCAGSPEPVEFLLAIAQDGIVIDILAGRLAREGDSYSTLVGPR